MSYTAWIILTASLVGIICGLVGVFLILRKTAMMNDAISHTVLLEIVLTFFGNRRSKRDGDVDRWYLCWGVNSFSCPGARSARCTA